MSMLLREAAKEITYGNYNLREKFSKIANKFIGHTEIEAQEAVNYLLDLNVSNLTRTCTFIKTDLPEKRIHVIHSNR